MTTGRISPRISLVASLKRVTNWPMLTPCWPRAGPTGGAGVAAPPGHCSFIRAVTCFAIALFLGLLHLVVFQLDRHRPAEDRQFHLQLRLGLQDLLHGPFHAVEGPV